MNLLGTLIQNVFENMNNSSSNKSSKSPKSKASRVSRSTWKKEKSGESHAKKVRSFEIKADSEAGGNDRLDVASCSRCSPRVRTRSLKKKKQSRSGGSVFISQLGNSAAGSGSSVG
jgi:hypothetical protein